MLPKKCFSFNYQTHINHTEFRYADLKENKPYYHYKCKYSLEEDFAVCYDNQAETIN